MSKDSEHFYILKWDVQFDPPLEGDDTPDAFNPPFKLIDNQIIRPNCEVDLFDWKNLKFWLNHLTEIAPANYTSCKGEVIGNIVKNIDSNEFSNKFVKVVITPKKVSFIPCNVSFSVKKLNDDFPSNLNWIHLLKWDIDIDDENVDEEYLKPCIIQKGKLMVNCVYDIIDWDDGLKYYFEEKLFPYCKENKIKIKGEVLGYLYYEEFPYQFPDGQIKISITTNKLQILPCQIKVNGKKK